MNQPAPDNVALYTTAHEVVDLLNGMIAVDRHAVELLVGARVVCNEEMADHPTVQVSAGTYSLTPAQTADGKKEETTYTVGMLGVLNGMFGVDPTGWGCIVAHYESASVAGEVGDLIRFSVAGPRSPSEMDGVLSELARVVALRQRHDRASQDLRRIGKLLLDNMGDNERAACAGVLFDDAGHAVTLREDFEAFLMAETSVLAWERIYSDDVADIPNLAIYTARSEDNGCRIYGVRGAANMSYTHDPKEHNRSRDGDYIEVFNFQAGDPRVAWNGMTSTAWMEIIKHHLASFTAPTFRYREALPGSRWSAMAIDGLERAGAALRRRLRYRVHAGIFGPPGSHPNMDTLGNPLPEQGEPK